MNRPLVPALLSALLLSSPAPVLAQQLETSERAPDAQKVVALYPGTAPGSENWTWSEQVSSPPWGGARGRLVRNVRQPTLTVFKPVNPKRASGTAVIVAPGGGFRWLSIDSEGYDVARALSARGITAFVLKYRLTPTPVDEKAFVADAQAFLAGVERTPPRGTPVDGRPPAVRLPGFSPSENPGLADGLAAVAYVREHAAEFQVNPGRVGIVGFSAGGAVASSTVIFGQRASAPDFAGLIYGAPFVPVQWRKEMPPLFFAVASDDFAADPVFTAFQGARSAGVSTELHLYSEGGHGFGMEQRGMTADRWIDQFVEWIGARGFLTK